MSESGNEDCPMVWHDLCDHGGPGDPDVPEDIGRPGEGHTAPESGTGHAVLALTRQVQELNTLNARLARRIGGMTTQMGEVMRLGQKMGWDEGHASTDEHGAGLCGCVNPYADEDDDWDGTG